MLANHFAGAALSTEETEQNSKTLKFFIFQEPAVLLSPNSTTTPFSIFIGENSPVIKDAYIEFRGVAEASASARTITADVNQDDSFPTSRQQSFDLGTSDKPNYFHFIYGGSATASTTQYFAGIINNPGTYNFYLKTGVSGGDISMLQARMIITYTFSPPVSGTSTYPMSGEIVSPVFDTGAVNGAGFNYILLKGSTPVGTKARAQFATANDAAGPWTFLGPNCDTTSYYYDSALSSPEQSKEIKCYDNHNNKRYFKYKVILCSGDCSAGGDGTPQINDVIINWSP